ncbi:hypothetical protein FA15DRAFT_260610 [Coprinopsis marcescibilis]|uniref:F-box domain-containing protein n=1 Tax=Coprinopsis marcescibilis TaxID=230819 RepID=A0A5C3KF07_COPMA|nr:hypothetical protein FA15DRAFT_260610 [Coprinopsis marcescibilis]
MSTARPTSSNPDHALPDDLSRRRIAIETSRTDAMSPSAIVLIELPREVIHSICSFLDDDDVYSVAFACRCLHHIALPAYLARQGVTHHDGDFVVGNIHSEQAMKAIRSAQFSFDIHRFVYTFGLSNTEDSEKHALAQQTLKKIGHVQEAHIKFSERSAGMGAARYLQAAASDHDDRLPDIDSLESIVTLSRDWERFTDDLLGKAGCRSLLVRSDSQNCRISPASVEGAIGKGYLGFNSLHRWKLRALRLVLAPVRFLGLYAPKLETFHIHSSVLFHPSLCRWTLSRLSLPSLTAVSFNHLQTLTPQAWSILLPCINIPNLTKLSINLCAINSSDLYSFFARHPKIEELSFGFGIPKLISPPQNVLRNLRLLRAPVEPLVALLSSPLDPIATLESVRVLYRTRRGSPFMSNAINNDLAPICFRLRTVPEVILSVALQSGATDWLISSSNGTELPAHLDQDHTSTSLTGVMADLSHQLTPPTSITFTGSCVTELEVKVNQYVLTQSLVLALPKMLAAFTNTTRLDLVTLSMMSVGTYVYEQGLVNDPFELPERRDVFIRSVAKNCPSIRQIFVNGEEEDVPSRRAVNMA